MKKKIIVLMAILLTLSLIGCSGKKETTVVDNLPREQLEQEIRVTIDDFFVSLAEGEYEKLEDLDVFEDFDNAFSAEDMINSFGELVIIDNSEVKEQLEQDLANLVKSTVVKVILRYEIEDIIIEGDSAAVEGTLTMLDLEKMTDFEELFTEEDIVDISMKNFSSVLLMTSGNDKDKAKGLKELIIAILDEMITRVKEMDSVDLQTTIRLERVNGKWEFKK